MCVLFVREASLSFSLIARRDQDIGTFAESLRRKLRYFLR